MRALAAYRSLGAIDLRNVARDPMLRWVAVLTPLFGLLFRFAVPPIAVALEERLDFDLTMYYPLLMSFLPLMVAGMIGAVVGFLLLDQRDDQTMSALLVTPLSLGDYLRYRMIVLLALCVALSWITVPLAGLTETTWLQLTVTSIVAAPLAPIYALFLGSFAGNKVQGFALAKAIGIVILPCIAAYFVTGPWQTAFGVVPHYWSMKVFWLFDAGAPEAALAHAVVGLGWQGLVLVLLARRFSRIVRR
jgi:fluoroquinolone transport system permease protein